MTMVHTLSCGKCCHLSEKQYDDKIGKTYYKCMKRGGGELFRVCKKTLCYFGTKVVSK